MLNEDSLKIFKKYGFDTVNITSLGLYQDYDKLCDELEKEYISI